MEKQLLQQAGLCTHLEVSKWIFDNTVEGVMITDARARIQRINPVFTQITGYTQAEVLGQTPKILRSAHHEQPFYDAMKATIAQQGSWQGEIWNRRKNGEVYLQWMSIGALKDENGAVTHFISIFHDLTEIRAQGLQIKELVFTDPLTGMGNRNKLMQTLGQLLQSERREGVQQSHIALMCIDIGQLSLINGRFGMKAGDELIRQQARRLQQCLGKQLYFFRLTGDELVAVLSDISALSNAARLAAECIAQLQVPLSLNGEDIRLRPAVGLAVFPRDGEDADSLLACAQAAMVAAKQAGRDNYRFYDETLSNELCERMKLEQQLWMAIQSETALGLELYLQPKVSLNDQALVGAEVLLRWRHPEKGSIAPDQFIPLAEDSGLIVSLDRWVFSRACALLQKWQVLMPKPLKLSINLSALQLQEPDLVQWCLETVARHGLRAEQLELEVTETAFINLADEVLEQMAKLREAGFSLALDDFGTGYSSLTYLRRLPLDVVKIDRSFVADLGTCERAATFLKGVIRLLSELGFNVVVEGVETKSQARFLQAAGCYTAQGFLYHRPMPADKFAQLYREEGYKQGCPQ